MAQRRKSRADGKYATAGVISRIRVATPQRISNAPQRSAADGARGAARNPARQQERTQPSLLQRQTHASCASAKIKRLAPRSCLSNGTRFRRKVELYSRVDRHRGGRMERVQLRQRHRERCTAEQTCARELRTDAKELLRTPALLRGWERPHAADGRWSAPPRDPNLRRPSNFLTLQAQPTAAPNWPMRRRRGETRPRARARFAAAFF